MKCLNCENEIDYMGEWKTARKYCLDNKCRRERRKKEMRFFRIKAGPGHEKKMQMLREKNKKNKKNKKPDWTYWIGVTA
jgi:hypothetical protein